MFHSHWRPFQGFIVRNGMRVCTLIMLCVMTLQLHAIDITELQVYENGGIYYIRMIAEIDAPVEYVHKVLTDYVHIYRLNPSITESQILPSPDNSAVRVKIRILDCIFIFCMELDRVEDVYELPTYDLHTVIVPTLSNFRSGKADWHIEGSEERCRVIYEAQMEPNFRIIPVIGPSFVKSKLRKEMVTSLGRIECIAKIQEELDWNLHLQAANVDINTVCDEKCDSSTGQCQP
jgi:hypothetical protein